MYENEIPTLHTLLIYQNMIHGNLNSCRVPNPSQSESEPRIAEPFANKRKNIRPETGQIGSFGVLVLSFANRFAICGSKSDGEGFST